MDTAFYPVGSPCLRGSTVLVFLTRNEFCIDFRGPHFNNWRFSILQIFGVFTGWVSLAMDLESSLMIYSKTTSSELQTEAEDYKSIILLDSRYRDWLVYSASASASGLLSFLRHRQSTLPRVYRRFATRPAVLQANFCFWLRQFSFHWSLSGGFVSRIEGKWKLSDSSDYDSVGLTPPFFDFH